MIVASKKSLLVKTPCKGLSVLYLFERCKYGTPTKAEGRNNSLAAIVYPNPNEGWFYLTGTNQYTDETGTLIISNLQGQVIYRENITLAHGSWKYKYYLKEQGMYFIRLQSEHQDYRGVVVKINQ